jgi:hypothetical protein
MSGRQRWAWSLALAIWSCSGPAEPVGEGQRCFRAEDCDLGLVCIERVCSSDLTPIVPEGAGMMAGAAGAGAEMPPAAGPGAADAGP